MDKIRVRLVYRNNLNTSGIELQIGLSENVFEGLN